MPIFASNFAANALQGTVTVAGGLANIVLPLSAFAFEGTKTFVVKLRKEGFTGTVIGTSNTITIPDTTTIVSLTANAITSAEGNVILYTLTTANVVNGTNVYYSTNSTVTANVNTSDFVGGNTGIITINNNIGTLSLTTNADLSLFDETNETFTLQIRTNNTAGNVVITSSNVLVLDTSNQYNVLSFVENASSVTEGGTLTLTANVINIAAGTLLYYDTTGNVTTSNFTGGNTGSFRMNSVSNTISLVTTSSVPYGTSVDFRVRIRRDSVTGTVLATSNSLIINDGALSSMYATGGNVALIGTFKYHTYNTSGTFTVTSAGTTGNIEYLVVGGGGAGSTGKSNPTFGAGSGGGAGGYRTNVPGETSGGGSPAEPALILTAGTYTVTVGAGGAAPPTTTISSGNSSNITGPGVSIISYGGGGGMSYNVPVPSANVGSGGGVIVSGGGTTGGTGTPGQGYPGLSNPTNQYPNQLGGGGGGAGGAASYGPYFPNGGFPFSWSTAGGTGKLSTAWQYQAPSPVGAQYAIGGSGGSMSSGNPAVTTVGYYPASPGQRANSAGNGSSLSYTRYPGATNTGDGGGGGGVNNPGDPGDGHGGDGGSGIVIIRYPFTAQYFTNLSTSASVLLGDNIIFNLSVLNANGATLYYSTDGNANSSYFISGNTGSFTANATGATITLQTNGSAILDVSRQFALQIRQDSVTGPVSITSSNVRLVQGIGVNYILVGGGGSGQATDNASLTGGGGGAGGVLIGNATLVPGVTYNITLGSGGIDGTTANGARGWWGYNNANPSTLVGGSLSLTANAGGYGGTFWGTQIVAFGAGGLDAGQYFNRTQTAGSGGSGGGAGQTSPFPGPSSGNPYSYPQLPAGETANPGNLAGGTGSPGQGYPGGNVTLGAGQGSSGGGGAGGAGQPAALGGNGGAAVQWLDGNWYGGGGAGKSGGLGGGQPPANFAMKGGGGDFTSGAPGTPYGAGIVNTGGGGASSVGKPYPWSPTTPTHSNGGSGIVVLRYPNTLPLATSTTGANTVVYANANIYYRFTSSGTITF